MSAVLRLLAEDFAPSDELRGFRPAPWLDRRWMCGRDTKRVYAFSLSDEILPAKSSEPLAAAPVAGVVAPLVAGALTGSFHLYVLCADGAIRDLDPDRLWLLDVCPVFHALTQGAMAVGYWGIYTSSDRPGEVVFFDEILGAPAGRVLVPNRGYWKFITAVPEDGIDTLYAVDTDGRWSVLQQTNANGLELVPEAAIADTPNVTDVRAAAEYDHWSVAVSAQFAALTCGPEGRGRALYFSLADRRLPTLTGASLAYAPYDWTGISGAMAADRVATETDAAQFPEIPWWHPAQLAGLRNPAMTNPLDGIVTLRGQRTAWVTTEPTTPPTFGPPAPISPDPTCSISCASAVAVPTVDATVGWAVGLDALPIQSAVIEVTGASTATVPVSAPGIVAVPLANDGAHLLTLNVTDRAGRLATDSAPCTRNALPAYPVTLTTSNQWGFGCGVGKVPGVEIDGEWANFPLWWEAVRKGLQPIVTGAGWKIVMCTPIPTGSYPTVATYADLIAYEASGGTYPAGGIPCSVEVVDTSDPSWDSQQLRLVDSPAVYTIPPGPDFILFPYLVAPSGRVLGRTFYDVVSFGWGSVNITNILGPGGIFLLTGDTLAAMVVGIPTTSAVKNMSNDIDFDALTTLDVACEALDIGGAVVRSGTISSWTLSVTPLPSTGEFQYDMTNGTCSIPLNPTDPLIKTLRLRSVAQPNMAGGAHFINSAQPVTVDPAAYSSIAVTAASRHSAPGFIP